MSEFNNLFRIYSRPAVEFCSFGNLTRPFRSHFHDHYLIGCLLSGGRLFYCGGTETLIAPFELVVINPGQAHGCAPVGGEAADWLCVHISRASMAAALNRDILPRFTKNILDHPQLTQDFLSFVSCLRHCPEDANARLPQLLGQLADAAQADYAASHPRAFATLCDHMDAQCAQKISLGQMSRLLRMDKFTLVRKFAQTTGLTPHRYLDNVRLNKGLSLLRQGYSICRSAQECGFCDQSHFNRHFKANIGFSPGIYQAACKEENFK